jgi:glycosyltransferase involved in cell wall biosynthesis
VTEHDVTLVVTAHRVQHLGAALASVAEQTSRRFDLVCCADSTGDAGVLAVFADAVRGLGIPRMKVVSVAGGTAGRVRNAGFASAGTPWVVYLDGDDVLHPRAMEFLTAATTDDADIVSTGMWRITAGGDRHELPESLHYLPPPWLYEADPEKTGHATYFNQLLAIRRELWASYPFDETTNGEDIDFMLHQLLEGRFRKLPRALYGYRDTAGSFSKRRYPHGDLCTRRYGSGYYAHLFATRYRPEMVANFSSLPDP